MIDDNEGEPLELTSDEELPKPETGENGTGEEEVAETEEQSEVEEEQPKKGNSVQERIDEIYRRQKEAEREAEFWRTKALEREPVKQPEPEASPRPNPEDYAYGDADPAYSEALIDWKAEQIFQKRFAEHSEKLNIEQQATQLDRTYAQHVAAVREEFPDYDEKVTNAGRRGEWPCPKEVAALIKSSPVGPKVAYHLATNLDDAHQLASLPPIQQAAAFGMIAAQYVNQPAPKQNIATNAPMPAPARTKGGQFAATNELRDDLSQKDWLARREAQLRSRG